MHVVAWWFALQFVAGSALGASACASAALERYEPRSFLGYACEDDCQRHKAGFAWAERQAVTEAVECTPLAPPEAEGCLAYLQERLTPEQAGLRWAVENEIAVPCLCGGAGNDFRAGCLRYAAGP